jgi:hypothetical protein
MFNSGVISTYLGSSLMEHFHDPVETIINLESGGGVAMVKGKGHPITGHQGPREGIEV